MVVHRLKIPECLLVLQGSKECPGSPSSKSIMATDPPPEGLPRGRLTQGMDGPLCGQALLLGERRMCAMETLQP